MNVTMNYDNKNDAVGFIQQAEDALRRAIKAEGRLTSSSDAAFDFYNGIHSLFNRLEFARESIETFYNRYP